MREPRMTLCLSIFKFNINEISDTTTEGDEELEESNKRIKKKKRRVKPDPKPIIKTNP